MRVHEQLDGRVAHGRLRISQTVRAQREHAPCAQHDAPCAQHDAPWAQPVGMTATGGRWRHAIDSGLGWLQQPQQQLQPRCLGVPLPTLAQYVLDQSQQGVDSFQNPQADLQRELADVKKQLAEFKNGFSERETQRQQQERERSTNMLQEQIADFANRNDRFNELYEQIEVELHNPRFEAGKDPIQRLSKAYEKVAKLNPPPSLSPPAPDLPAQDAAVQSRRGTASITGAPSGSTPAGKRPVASSAREAARMALSKMGMGSGA
jgi:hypothetical protein